MSIFEKVSGKIIAERAGGSSPMTGLLGSAAATIGLGLVKSMLPRGVGPVVDVVNNVAGAAARGDWQSVADKAINSGIFTAKLPWLDNAHAAYEFARKESRAMGGVTPLQAKRIFQSTLETHFARKNLFMVTIEKAPKGLDSMMESVQGTGFQTLNMFVLDVSYGPITITADSHKIGSAVLDQPNGTEPIELRLTTRDDENGRVRHWFSQLAGTVANTDGTFGVPDQYLIKISITHSFIDEASSNFWLGCKPGVQAWKQTAWFRPVSLESDLSRKDDGPEEFSLTFHQFDTYF